MEQLDCPETRKNVARGSSSAYTESLKSADDALDEAYRQIRAAGEKKIDEITKNYSCKGDCDGPWFKVVLSEDFHMTKTLEIEHPFKDKKFKVYCAAVVSNWEIDVKCIRPLD